MFYDQLLRTPTFFFPFMLRSHVHFNVPFVSTVTNFHRVVEGASYNNGGVINHVYYHPYYDAGYNRLHSMEIRFLVAVIMVPSLKETLMQLDIRKY